MTTVNIQHFESVQEIVSRVTGVDVRERVPDRLLRQADAIVNVDLPSDELRERGSRPARSIPADRISAALENFFKEENLASLRELAMRQIADRLEAERRGPDSPSRLRRWGPRSWSRCRPIRRRPGCCCGAPPRSPEGSTRTGSPSTCARRKKARERISARDHRLLSENVTLAMELGAKVVWLTSEDVAGELLRFAREQGITLAIFGKSRRSVVARMMKGSPIDAFAAAGTGIDVYEVETTAD